MLTNVIRKKIKGIECVQPFTTSTCLCFNCKSQYNSGVRTDVRCICAREFDLNVSTYNICRQCRKAFAGHGTTCCEWKWMPLENTCNSLQTKTQNTNHTTIQTQTTREEELGRRLRWCIDNSMFPAHENVHKAPSSSEQDRVFGQDGPPWNSDGSLNAKGVGYGRGSDIHIEKHLRIVEFNSSDSSVGWNCRNCSQWVNSLPREFVGGKEPLTWWMCLSCKSSVKAETSSAKRKRVAASGTKDIRTFNFL